jgi:hypothetical protein
MMVLQSEQSAAIITFGINARKRVFIPPMSTNKKSGGVLMKTNQSANKLDDSLRLGNLEFEISSCGKGRIHNVWFPNRHIDKSKKMTKITCAEVMAGVSNVLQQILSILEGDYNVPDTHFSIDYCHCRYVVMIADSRDCFSVCVSIYSKTNYENLGGIELC